MASYLLSGSGRRERSISYESTNDSSSVPLTEHATSDSSRLPDIQEDNIETLAGDSVINEAGRRSADGSGIGRESRLHSLKRRVLTSRRLLVYKFRRFPRGTAVWLVFLMFFFYGVAEYSMTLILFFSLNAYHKLNPPQTVATYLGARFLAFTMYPVMGFLADTFFGRYKVLLAGLHIAWVGSAILCVCFAFVDPYLDNDVSKYQYGTDASWPKDRVVTLAICYGIMWTGFTGIRVNLIPFGVDQLPEASGGELSSYFHWYYWFINFGSLFSSMAIPELYKVTALSYSFLITNFCFSCMIILLILLRFKFNILPKIGNPFKLVGQVVRFAMKTKRARFTSAFQLGQSRPSRMDLAKISYGGKFTVEQVEDVKTFFRILMILVSFFGYFAIFSQLQSTYLMEAMRMSQSDGLYEDCPEGVAPSMTVKCQFWKLSPAVMVAFANIIPVLFLLPLLDRLIYPCLFSQTPPMLTRIAVGKVFLLISIAIAIGIEVNRVNQLARVLKDSNETLVINAIPFHTGSSTTLHVASPVPIGQIVPQYFLFAFADVLSSVTAVEFIYAQSPGHMKGILLGLLFGTEGIATGFASILIWLQDAFPNYSFFSFFANSNTYYKYVDEETCTDGSIFGSCADSPLFAYIVFLLVTLLSVTFFTISALRYKLRRRDPDPAMAWLYGGNFERGLCNCCFQ